MIDTAKGVEERDAQARDHKAYQAREAKRILSEPLVEGFLKDSEAETLEALKRLPLGATLAQYQVIHHDLMASMRFKSKLETCINEHEMILLQERAGEAEGI